MDLQGLIDYHTHTAVTIDSDSTVEACCRRASELGLAELAFTNHVILGNLDYCMSPAGMQEHWRQIQESQKSYPGLTIRLGIEVDYFEGREDEIAGVIRYYEKIAGRPFDFVMGAIHYLRGIFFSSKIYAPELFGSQGGAGWVGSDRSIDTIYNVYFVQVGKAVRSGLFDIMAHLDLIKKYSEELSPRLSFDRYRAAAEIVVRALVESNVGIEINTKGLTMKVAELYPSGDLLSLYIAEARAHGVEPIITIGADSHHAKNVGALFEEGILALQRAGCYALTGFHLRKPYLIQIHPIPNKR